MAYESKKGLDVVKEQPGSKQKLQAEDKAPKEKDSFKEPAESRHESKPGKEGRLKNEQAANMVQTGLDHPQHQYDSYKRPRRDS